MSNYHYIVAGKHWLTRNLQPYSLESMWRIQARTKFESRNRSAPSSAMLISLATNSTSLIGYNCAILRFPIIMSAFLGTKTFQRTDGSLHEAAQRSSICIPWGDERKARQNYRIPWWNIRQSIRNGELKISHRRYLYWLDNNNNNNRFVNYLVSQVMLKLFMKHSVDYHLVHTISCSEWMSIQAEYFQIKSGTLFG